MILFIRKVRQCRPSQSIVYITGDVIFRLSLNADQHVNLLSLVVHLGGIFRTKGTKCSVLYLCIYIYILYPEAGISSLSLSPDFSDLLDLTESVYHIVPTLMNQNLYTELQVVKPVCLAGQQNNIRQYLIVI